MGVLVIMDLHARPDSVDALRALLNPAQIRAYEGSEGVELAVNQDDANNVLLAARWASREAYEAYRAWRVEQGDQATLVALLEGGIGGLHVRVFDIVPRPARAGQGSRSEALEDLEEWARRWLGLRGEIRALNDAGLSNEHLGPVIRLHNEELDSIMTALEEASP